MAKLFSKRKVNTRLERKRFLIVCEGAKTEPNYFDKFRVPKEVRDIVPLGDNTLSLVEQAVAWKEAGDYDQTWCVFDRDSFPADRFNRAIARAEAAGMKVAYSNEAFELWYLLHFDYQVAALSRRQYPEMLSQRLGHSYAKNSLNIYEELEHRQSTAIRNAIRLLGEYPAKNPERDNPSTTVHLLVMELIREVQRHFQP